METPEQADGRAARVVQFTAAFYTVALKWADVQHWDDVSGRITVVRSKIDVKALDAIRPAGAARGEKVFRLSESQSTHRVKAIARAAGLADWEFFSGHSGRVCMARRMAQNGAPTYEIER